MRPINEIVVHCSATRPDMDIGVEEIRQWHVYERNWSDIGYHVVIRRNGSVEEGRPVENIGAHARGHNNESIGICLVGGVDSNNRPDANFTLSQYMALARIVTDLKIKHPDIDKVSGHRDYSNMKACPCFDVEALLN